MCVHKAGCVNGTFGNVPWMQKNFPRRLYMPSFICPLYATDIGQTRIENGLKEETERNKDDIEHHRTLQEHYREQEKAYDVCSKFFSFYPADLKSGG
jgi:hypothetical protein